MARELTLNINEINAMLASGKPFLQVEAELGFKTGTLRKRLNRSSYYKDKTTGLYVFKEKKKKIKDKNQISDFSDTLSKLAGVTDNPNIQSPNTVTDNKLNGDTQSNITHSTLHTSNNTSPNASSNSNLNNTDIDTSIDLTSNDDYYSSMDNSTSNVNSSLNSANNITNNEDIIKGPDILRRKKTNTESNSEGVDVSTTFTLEEIKILKALAKQHQIFSALASDSSVGKGTLVNRNIRVYKEQYDVFAKWCKDNNVSQANALYEAIQRLMSGE